jgi:bla regulator protein BlaR1
MGTLDQIFGLLWTLSWQSAALAAVVLTLITLFRRRLSPGGRQLLWMLVFVRMVLPVLPESSMSLLTFFEKQTVISSPISITMISSDAPTAVSVDESEIIAIPEKSPGFEITRIHILFAIWVLGVAICIARTLVANVIFARRLKRDRLAATAGRGDDHSSRIARTFWRVLADAAAAARQLRYV